MLRIILELFVVEKYLLARCKHELRAAVYTLQNSIGEFHGRLPLQGASPKSAMACSPCRSRFPVLLRPVRQGPGPHKNSSGKKFLSGSPGYPAKPHAQARAAIFRVTQVSGEFERRRRTASSHGQGHAASRTMIDRNWRNAKANEPPRRAPCSSMGCLAASVSHSTDAAWVALFVVG
jgi:hypothetical protein